MAEIRGGVRCVVGLTVALLLTFAGRVGATNDETHIAEIMAGANGNSKIQFIVVRQEGTGNLWGPQPNGFTGCGLTTQSCAMLVFFDATGRETGQFKFPSDAPGPAPADVLIATQAFANLPGAPAPNFIIPPLLNPISGMVCFQSNPLNLAFPRKDCVSYGTFTGPTGGNSRNAAGPGAPAAPLPIVNTVSLRSIVPGGNDVNSDFSITATPTPRNNVGPAFTIPPATQLAQGSALFNSEPFLGNGRSCGSCHVASESFRLPPSNIQSRFATLPTPTSSFDPQFIAENVPSFAGDAGFDFNLNTLVLTAKVASPAPCNGELRGIITTPNGARARVLTRLEPTTPAATSTYLVYGGRNPALSGAVSDSNSCSATVSSITAGSLGAIPGSGVPGLEDPKRMRTSVDTTNFPQGRGLILENIDGFTNPAVFRKSPHLLNLSRTAPFGFNGNVLDLQTFATGAVTQHLPRTLARNSGGTNPDFRLPTAGELAAMEAFMLAQEFPEGNDPNKFDLNRFAVTPAQMAGRTAFFGLTAKCSQCHGGPVLAQTTASILGKPIGVNASFNTGVVNQLINGPAADNLPCEPSVGVCGSREFSVPQLFNVKNLGPFFHDGSAATVRQAVEFYNSAAFNNSPAGLDIGGINVSGQTIDDIVAFLEGLVVLQATQIAANSATSLSGTVAAVVSPAPSVIVRDAANAPVAGANVTFAVTSGGGSIGGATVIATDASGIATVGSWTLGPVAGTNNNTLTATVAGLAGSPVTFTASAAAGVATQIAVNAGNNQTATVATSVATAPSVIARDANNNPVAGVPVTFAVGSGGGSVTGASATTNASGIATVGSWTLGPVAGTNNNTLTATSVGLAGSPVTFTASAVAGPAAQIAVNAGNNQTATVGTAVATPPSVIVRDANNNPKAGVSVTFTAGAGGGSVTGPTTASDAAGIATVGSWKLGTVAGTNNNTLMATSAGLAGSPATFTASAVAGPATQIAVNAGNNQTALKGRAVATPPSVIVRDANGNPKAGVSVTFAVSSGGGSVTGATTTTNASGIATVGSWTLGTVLGTNNNTLIATSAGLAGSPVTFTASVVKRTVGDFDGDGKRDLAVYRPATGEWFVFGSATGFHTLLFGSPASSGLGDIPVAADFDGDGITDLAIYRQATGEWFVFGSATGFRTLLFGAPAGSGLGDIPVPADFDGDGTADLAVYRQATGEWFIFGSATGFRTLLFGAPAGSGLGDVPVPGDFEAAGRAGVAIYRSSTGQWFIFRSLDGQVQTTQFGAPLDLPVPRSPH